MKTQLSIMTIFTCLVVATSSDAALYSRLGGQAFYDDTADLTWLADANAAMGSGYDTAFGDGRMNLSQAVDWATNLNISGVTGWRLPTTTQPDFGCSRISNTGDYHFGSNCRASEMGNMFYNVLGGSESNSIASNHNANYDLFSNIQEAFYWSSTYRPGSTDTAIGLYFHSGYQNHNNQNMPSYAWAVHSGDVSAVPLPASLWLFVSGVLGLAAVKKRQLSSCK